MSRLFLFAFALLAILSVVFAQSSSTGILVDSSSSSASSLSSSSLAANVSSSSSSDVVVASSSSSTAEASSSSDFTLSSSTLVVDSSSSGTDINMSSSGVDMSSSSSFNPNPFVPVDWEAITISPNNTFFNITWGNKSVDNLMFGQGSSEGFIIDGVSGRTVRLVQGFTYQLAVDAVAAAHGFYITLDPRGNEIAGSNLSVVGIPITSAETFNVTIDIPSSDADVFVYYASNTAEFAGGSIIVGRQSAAALQASFAVMAISAFVALLFPKW